MASRVGGPMTSESPIVGRNQPNSILLMSMPPGSTRATFQRDCAGFELRHLEDGVVIDVPDVALLVDADYSAMGHAVGIEDAVLLGDLTVRVEVAEQRKVDATLPLEGLERPRAIYADAEDDGVVAELAFSAWMFAIWLRADAGEGGGEEVEDDVLAALLAELELVLSVPFSLKSGAWSPTFSVSVWSAMVPPEYRC